VFRRLSFALAALLVALVSAAGVSAAEPAPKGLAGAFELQGTNGYKLLGLIASTGKVGVLTLFVDSRHAGVTYEARGEVTKESAHFDLGRLGEINVAVQPTGRMETVRPTCGKPVTVEGSRYVGTIDFHGEEGFTEAEVTATPVRLKSLLEIVCPGFGVAETSGGLGPGVRLEAKRKGGPSLKLERNHPRARVFYEAEMQERFEGLAIRRTVAGYLGAGAFSVTPSLGAATFAAGSPFVGKATYAGSRPPHEIKPGEGTWRGSLAVNFPGRAHVRLAGPGFKASIIGASRHESHF
jgi:hypothetical protein